MNTIASVGRLYKLKLAQSQQPSNYLTSQYIDAAIQTAKEILPKTQRFVKLTSDKNLLYKYKGLYPQEWGKLWEELNKVCGAWVTIYNQQKSQLKENEKIISGFLGAKQVLDTMKQEYDKTLNKGSYSETARWIQENIGNQINTLTQFAQNKSRQIKYHDIAVEDFISQASNNLDKLQEYLKKAGVSEEDRQLQICKYISYQLTEVVEKLFEEAKEASEEYNQAKGGEKAFQEKNVINAWNKVSTLLQKLSKYKDALVDAQIPTDSSQASAGLEDRYNKIYQQAYIFLTLITAIANTEYKPISMEESWFTDYQGGDFE